MKLIHLANFNSTNVGNGALINGLESTLEEDFGVPVDWSRDPWDNYTFGLKRFDEQFVEKVNQSDGLIVGGAVTFNGRDYNDQTGTRFELPLNLWKKLRKPVVFYGLSYRHWSGQTYHHLDKFRETIQTILSSEHMILALRNDGTRDWLRHHTGIESNKIMEIPDSAVYVKARNDGCTPEIIEGSKNIIVSFNDEDVEYRYDESMSVSGVENRARSHVIKGLVHAIEGLAEKFPVNFILCPHYFDDYRMLSDVVASLKPRIAHQMTVSTGLCRVKDTEQFYARYQKADLAISMRVHSMSPCIGLATPMVAYTTQDRMTKFLDKVELADIAVNAFGIESGKTLLERARYTLDNCEQVRQRFEVVRASMRQATREFHERVKALLLA